MSPEQLRSLREARGLTREQLAAELGDTSASTVNKWERGMHDIPAWVEKHMLSNVHIQFPLTELHQLMDFARESQESFEAFLSTAISEFLTNRRAKQEPLKKSNIIDLDEHIDQPAKKGLKGKG